jgi:hypothetical protein
MDREIISRWMRRYRRLFQDTAEQYPNPDYPALQERHLNAAKLYPSRNELIVDLEFLRGGTIAEVGVALGDFTEYLLSSLAPKEFVAFDTFEMDRWASVWGVPTSTALKGMTHLDFYKTRFLSRGDQVSIEVGKSHDSLLRYKDKTFDMIYLDADHSYEAVKADAELAKAKIKDDGILMFNDYIMFDHSSREPYGVVQAVNEMIVAEDWRVIGYALNPHLFCDIAIRRKVT